MQRLRCSAAAEPLSEAKIKRDVLNAFPKDGTNVHVRDVIGAVEALERSPCALAASAAMRAHIDCALQLLRPHAEEGKPTNQMLANASDFFKECHLRLINLRAG